MAKTILITGATDGVGRATAKAPHAAGHTVLSATKLGQAVAQVGAADETRARGLRADLSMLDAVDALAEDVLAAAPTLDVLINNAGVFVPGGVSPDGVDIRFTVNTLTPCRLARRLWTRLGGGGRIVNLSRAAVVAAIDAAVESRLRRRRRHKDALFGWRTIFVHARRFRAICSATKTRPCPRRSPNPSLRAASRSRR